MIEKEEDNADSVNIDKNKKTKGQDTEVGWTPELDSERDRFKVALGRYFLTNNNNNDRAGDGEEEESLRERTVPLIETVRTVAKYITELKLEESSGAIKFVFPSLFVSAPPEEIQPTPPTIDVGISIETPSKIVSLTSIAHQDRLTPTINDDGALKPANPP